jgi:hypothetical protein
MFFSPAAVLLIPALIGAWQSRGRFPRTGRAIAVAATLILIVAAMTPLGLILPGGQVSATAARYAVALRVLGGAINGPTS